MHHQPLDMDMARLMTPTLEELCREPVIRNVEVFPPNGYYGHADALKRYAAYPLEKPLKAVIQHGYNFLDDQFIFGGEMEAALPVFFPPNPQRAGLYHEASGGKPAIPIGAPFLYAQRLIEEVAPIERQPQRAGTLVFPIHSTRLIEASFDHEEYANLLDSMPEEFKPISVSIYWRDFLDGKHLPYAKKGFEIVSAGHMLDPGFIYRVYLNCRRFKYACSNEYSSSLFYAVASGCRFFHLPSGPVSHYAKNPEKLVFQTLTEPQRKNFEKLFSYSDLAPFAEQSAFALSALGADCIKTPQELNALLRWAERQDWLYFTPLAIRNRENLPDWFLRLPPRIRRVKRLKKLAGKLNR